MKNTYQVVPQAATTKKPAKAEVSDAEFRRRLKNISDWRKERFALRGMIRQRQGKQLVSTARRLKDLKELKIERPPRIKVSTKESLTRIKEFDKRKESFIAAVKKSKS